MRTTKLVFFAIIGLAMLELSFGYPCSSLAAATAAKTSPASAKIASPVKSVKKSHAITRTHWSDSPLEGIAVYYSDRFEGRKTANGQRFNQKRLTAAHRTLPFGTKVRVTNIRNNHSVEVVINDRGPWPVSRIIDLSSAAAARIGMLKAGKAPVKLEILSRAAADKL